MTRTKHKKTNWPKGVSDTMLLDLCRRVIMEDWGEQCAFAVYLWTECRGSVQWHHIKRRNIPHLRYCPENGIPLCEEHHRQAKFSAFKKEINDRVNAHYDRDVTEWLDIMESKLFPAFLAEKGQTRGEYLLAQRDYLRALLNGGAE